MIVSAEARARARFGSSQKSMSNSTSKAKSEKGSIFRGRGKRVCDTRGDGGSIIIRWIAHLDGYHSLLYGCRYT